LREVPGIPTFSLETTPGPPHRMAPDPPDAPREVPIKVLATLIPIFLLGLFQSLGAQQAQGDVELQLSGALLSTIGQEDGALTTGILQTKAGYFITDHVELGAFPSLLLTRVRVDTPGGSTTTSSSRIGMGVFGTYSFLTEGATTVPHVGAQLYRMDLTDEDETGWLGATAGAKFYINRSTAFDLTGNYLLGLGERGGALVLLQAGMSFLF
jgi:hypothetical protein